MEALRILIVEDDLLLATELEEQLLEFGYSITDNVANSKNALLSFRRRLPDLVLCDIQLKGSELDGIELVGEFNKISKVPIVFLSALGDQGTVTRAREVNPAYYLVKPCNAAQLRVALDFAIANFSADQQADPSHSLKFQEAPEEKIFAVTDFFFIKDSHKYIRIKIKDILWVEALGSNVKIITNAGTSTLAANLSSFSQQVTHDFLVRVHRSFIINIHQVLSFSGGRLFLQYKGGEQEIPIGKTYREDVKQLFPKLTSD